MAAPSYHTRLSVHCFEQGQHTSFGAHPIHLPYQVCVAAAGAAADEAAAAAAAEALAEAAVDAAKR